MPRILVIDDEKNIRFTLREFLKDAGHQVDCAASAEEGLALLQAIPIDVVVSDIILPGMHGTELLERINDLGLDTRTILITGKASLDNATRALRFGADDFLQKPVSRDQLFASLARSLENQENERKNRRLIEENRRCQTGLEDQIRARAVLLEKLSHRLIGVREREERTVAEMLRQRLSSRLTTLQRELQAFLQELKTAGIEKTRSASLTETVTALGEATVSLLPTAFRLSYPFESGLQEGLEDLVRGLGEGVPIVVALATAPTGLCGEPLSIILQIIREALVNARNHSRARLIEVHGSATPNGYRLEVRDDGSGFDPARLGTRAGLGLYLMQERAGEIGASIRIDSQAGAGCRVVLDLTFPLKHRKTT